MARLLHDEALLMPPLKPWLEALCARGWHHAILVLALVVTANAWVLNPASGRVSVTDLVDPAADSSAILGGAEDAETAKSQLDDVDKNADALAYAQLPCRPAARVGLTSQCAAKSHDQDTFPHKTGPPARG
jgi:hypothetical protein